MLEAAGDVSHDAIKERPEARAPGGIHPRKGTPLAEAVDEHILDGIVDLPGERTAAPPREQVSQLLVALGVLPDLPLLARHDLVELVLPSQFAFSPDEDRSGPGQLPILRFRS